MQNKANQHYIPKFYLRNFSYNQNGAQVGLFNQENEIYVKTAKIKSQASGRYFYGEDGRLEDLLSNIENHVVPLIQNLITTDHVPLENSKIFNDILIFLILTTLRTPTAIDNVQKTRNEMKRVVEKEYGDFDSRFDEMLPEIPRSEAISISLSQIQESVKYCIGLRMKLILNGTSTPFITSDYPVVQYNQFLERKNWKASDIGFGKKGLQIIFPISPEKMLLLYDRQIYDFGNKKHRLVKFIKLESIDQLNLLQMLNCDAQLFFNETCTEDYISKLHAKSKKYQKGNEVQVTLGHRNKEDGDIERNSIIQSGTSNLRIKLKLEQLRHSRRGKKEKLDKNLAQSRKLVKRFEDGRGQNIS